MLMYDSLEQQILSIALNEIALNFSGSNKNNANSKILYNDKQLMFVLDIHVGSKINYIDKLINLINFTELALPSL